MKLKKVAPESAVRSRRAGDLGRRIESELERVGLSIGDLAEKLEISYEHARKLCRGEAVPSRHLYGPLAEFLKLEQKEVASLADEDRVRFKYPDVSVDGSGRNPEIRPLERDWDDLDSGQKSDLMLLASRWASRNRKHPKKDKKPHSGKGKSL